MSAYPIPRLTPHNRRRAMAYFAVLVLLMLTSTLGMAFVFKATTEAKATLQYSNNMQAQYLAESAVAHALWRLLNEPAFPASEDIYYMHTLGEGRYGYKVRRHTTTTFATISAVGATGDTVVRQSNVVFIKP